MPIPSYMPMRGYGCAKVGLIILRLKFITAWTELFVLFPLCCSGGRSKIGTVAIFGRDCTPAGLSVKRAGLPKRLPGKFILRGDIRAQPGAYILACEACYRSGTH